MNQNNSIEMNTQVETFLIEETQELIYNNEKLELWNSHVKELGLTGQTKIVSGDKSPIPFMHMKRTIVEMFKVLCPRIVEVSEYDISPIPVEILDLIALSKRENYFNRIEVWYDDKNPDPICVGIIGEYIPRDKQNNWYWSDKQTSLANCIKFLSDNGHDLPADEKNTYHFSESKRYLMGKWADVKSTFQELRERAKQRFVAEKSALIRKELKEKQRELDDIELKAIELIGA